MQLYVSRCIGIFTCQLLHARMSQQELADRLGVTRQQIHTYTTGNRLMTLPIAMNIATVLHCEITELYEWIPVEVRNKRR